MRTEFPLIMEGLDDTYFPEFTQLIRWVATSHLTSPGKPSSWSRRIASSHFALHQQLWNVPWHQQTLTRVWSRPELPSWGEGVSEWVNYQPERLIFQKVRQGHALPTHIDCANLWANHGATTVEGDLSGNRTSVSFLQKAKPGVRMWRDELLAWIHIRLKFCTLGFWQSRRSQEKNSDLNRQQSFRVWMGISGI